MDDSWIERIAHRLRMIFSWQYAIAQYEAQRLDADERKREEQR